VLGLLAAFTVTPCVPYIFAASVEVSAGAARTGSYGVEVTIGTACVGDPNPVLEEHEVVGVERFEGCDSLTAADGFVVSATGRAILAAGGPVTLGNGFVVEEGGELVVRHDISLSDFAWIEDFTPPAVDNYTFELHANLDGLDLVGELEHFVAYSANGTPVLKVVLGPGPTVVLAVWPGNGEGYRKTDPAPLAAGWNAVSVTWEASSSPSPTLEVNGSPRVPVRDALDNSTARIDSVRWGGIDGDPANAGAILMDDFTSRWCEP
jgi:hypothetical protein